MDNNNHGDKRHARKGQRIDWPTGPIVRNVPLDDATARRLRTLALAQYGKADKEACSKFVASLVGEVWQQWNAEIDAKAEALAEVEGE